MQSGAEDSERKFTLRNAYHPCECVYNRFIMASDPRLSSIFMEGLWKVGHVIFDFEDSISKLNYFRKSLIVDAGSWAEHRERYDYTTPLVI